MNPATTLGKKIERSQLVGYRHFRVPPRVQPNPNVVPRIQTSCISIYAVIGSLLSTLTCAGFLYRMLKCRLWWFWKILTHSKNAVLAWTTHLWRPSSVITSRARAQHQVYHTQPHRSAGQQREPHHPRQLRHAKASQSTRMPHLSFPMDIPVFDNLMLLVERRRGLSRKANLASPEAWHVSFDRRFQAAIEYIIVETTKKHVTPCLDH